MKTKVKSNSIERLLQIIDEKHPDIRTLPYFNRLIKNKALLAAFVKRRKNRVKTNCLRVQKIFDLQEKGYKPKDIPPLIFKEFDTGMHPRRVYYILNRGRDCFDIQESNPAWGSG